jgi:hypothetical protein
MRALRIRKLTGVEHGGSQAESQHQFDSTTVACAVLTNGWSCYKNSKKLPPMRLDTLKILRKLFDLGSEVKSKRILADRAHAIVMEEIAAEDWHEHLLGTGGCVKAVFGYSKDNLIKFADVPSGAHTDETSEDIEESKLDEAWDMNAAEDAPTQCLTYHEEESDGFE